MQPHRQSHNINQNNSRALQRNPSGKLSYSPGHWKNYIATDLIRRPQQSKSNYENGHRLSTNVNNSYYLQQQLEQNNQAAALREQKQRKKQEMLKRVKQIQERVMPLIENDYTYKNQQDISWKTKIEQKVAKLQTAVDAIQKTLQIRLQKQVLQLQKKMQLKYLQLQAKLNRSKQIQQ